MPSLPRLSGREVLQALVRAGGIALHQKGSHVYVRMPGVARPVSVPMHPEISRGTLRAILREAGIAPGDLRRLL
ncbi:MAG TPA: type II toxin-antitoxin system HicA family toxin [Thermoplasmata archaeon]|nr:type II toxin-antitoxin system HicA family toxin [Thermoplasmata archaeon]